MKKYCITILLFATLIGNAQNAFTFGKKYGVMNLDNINRTVYSYNYARTWLTQKMPYFHYMQGYEGSWQHRGELVGFEMVFSRISETNTAFGFEPTSNMMGYRKIKIGYGGMSGGITVKVLDTKHFEIVPSLDADLHFFTGSTTYSNDAAFAGGTEESVIYNIKLASTLSVNFSLMATSWFGINIRPYYQQPLGKTNVEGLAAYWGGSGTGSQRENVQNYGISASLILEFGRDVD